MSDERREEERRHQAEWDRSSFGFPTQQALPDNVDRLFEEAWVALERQRVSTLAKLPGARDQAEEAAERLAEAKREASEAESVVDSLTETLRRLIEQQKAMAG